MASFSALLKSFLKTPPLWKATALWDLHQFYLPEVSKSIHFTLDDELEYQRVLGKQMERLFEYFISKADDYRILDKNFQIHQNKITLGEIDFLLENIPKQQFLHVEMVYKFYIYDPSLSGYKGWIGPNRRDSLLQKITKLKTKQFPFLYHPLTENYLNSLGVSAFQFEQQVCFKAFLFLPKNGDKINLLELNEACLAGYWIHFSEFQSKYYKDKTFICPPKQDWPLPPESGENWISFSVVCKQIQYFFLKNKSPLIWMKIDNFNYERFFVVSW